MNKLFKLFVFVLAISLGATLVSCSTDSKDTPAEYLAVATAIPGTGDAGFLLKVDKNTTLRPVNVTKCPFEKETRVFVRYYEVENQTSSAYKEVNLLAISDMLTKDLAENKGTDNAKEYGSDALAIYDDWSTVAEDGYMTIHFCAFFGRGGITHSINLVDVSDAEHPNKFRLYHNAHNDISLNTTDGYAAFRIFPRSECDKDATIELEWDDLSGAVRQVKFQHNPTSPVQKTAENPEVNKSLN